MPRLVHIQGAVDLDLQRLHPPFRMSVEPGGETAGKGRVADDAEPPLAQYGFRCRRDLGAARGAVAVAEHEIHARPAVGLGHRPRRHRMAVEKDRVAEPRPCVAKHRLERAVIGEIARSEAPARLGAGQQAAIDRRAVGHDARDRAEAAPHPRRAPVDPRGKGVGEHRGVELARLAVRVHERPREARRHERRPQSGRAGDQFVDPAVLGTPQGVHVDRHPGEERLAIVPPAMRRGHRHGQRLRDRPRQRDR